MTRRIFRGSIFAGAVAAGLTPLTFSADQGLSQATAECTSCCKEMRSKCIKCVGDCVVVENAYDGGGGSCVLPPP